MKTCEELKMRALSMEELEMVNGGSSVPDMRAAEELLKEILSWFD